MEWVNKIDRIVVLNLRKRTDRLLQFAEMMEDLEIPFEVVTSIENDNGAIGLKDTMIKLFKESLEKGVQHLLVFEDDALAVVGKDTIHETMNKIMDNFPERYVMLFLGCQLSGRIQRYHSPNIFLATKMFSTHAVMYSERGMREILASDLQSPIDNHYVAFIEQLEASYTVYPLLFSQREGYSDIGKEFFSWRAFIEPRYDQKINEYKHGLR